MPNNAMSVPWKQSTQETFNQLIAKVPVFLQEMARDKISKKAEKLCLDNKISEVTEKEMVDAFFAETPFGFHGPMKSDMEAIGLDYTKYGYQK